TRRRQGPGPTVAARGRARHGGGGKPDGRGDAAGAGARGRAAAGGHGGSGARGGAGRRRDRPHASGPVNRAKRRADGIAVARPLRRRFRLRAADGRRRSEMSTTLDPDAVRALVEGEHGDPFAVLGPHPVRTTDGAAIIVRAIVPGATAVRVLAE